MSMGLRLPISIHEAAFEGDVAMIRYLLHCFHRDKEKVLQLVNQKDEEQTTPLHQAVFSDQVEVTKLLIERGADVNLVDEDGSAPLLHAAYSGSLRCVKLLIRNGADVNACDKELTTPLQKASYNGNLSCVRYLISKGAKINFRDNDGATPLHHAAFQGHSEVVRTLVFEYEADINCGDCDGLSPLHKAVFSNHPACVEILIKGEADVNQPDNEESTPLHFASEKNLMECATLLLSNGANPNAQDAEGLRALHHSCFYGHLELTKFLIDKGASLNTCDNLGSTPLHNAAFNGHSECMAILLSRGVQVNSPHNSTSALHHAAYNGHLQCLEMLLENKAHVNAMDGEGATPLHKAAYMGNLACLQRLLEGGADFNIQDREGSYPLHKAAFSNRTECLEALIKRGAAVDVKDFDDGTPLHNAAFGGHLESLEILLANNANPNSEDDRGASPLHLAIQNGHLECAQLLLSKCAKIDNQDEKGMSPLHYAVRNPECVQFLVNQGAEVDCKDFKGRTPLYLALKVENIESIRILIKAGSDIEAKDKEGRSVKDLVHGSITIDLLARITAEREETQDQKYKAEMAEAVQKFNGKPMVGIEWLIDRKLMRRNAEDIAKFLLTAEGLSKTKLGEFLGKDDAFNLEILQAYVDNLQFTGMMFDEAIRLFLGKFKLPGEAQIIDRLMERFAGRYVSCNPSVFQYQDTCYMLAFATIMLNTDAHNPQIKEKMSKEAFLANNRRLNMAESVPDSFLEDLYDRIVGNEIKMEMDGVMFGSAEKKGWLVKQGGRIPTWKKRWFILTHNCLYYFIKQEDKDPCGMLPLENLAVRRSAKVSKKFCFEIYDPRIDDSEAKKKLGKKQREELKIKSCKKAKEGEGFRQGHHKEYLISATSQAEMEAWMDAITRNIHSSPMNKILDLRLQSTKANATSGTTVERINFAMLNWKEIYALAEMCSLCKMDEETLREKYKRCTVIADRPHSSAKYCLVIDSERRTQTIVLHGTKWDPDKALVDDFLLCADTSRYKEVDMFDRYEFKDAVDKIQTSVEAHLNKEYSTLITGHSLGGALVVLLGFHLRKAYRLFKVVSFGAPKINTEKGVENVKKIPLLRIVDFHDSVPNLFPGYCHSGQELILLRDKFFTLMSEAEARDIKPGLVDEKWAREKLNTHRIEHYLKRIEAKTNGAVHVNEFDRDKFA